MNPRLLKDVYSCFERSFFPLKNGVVVTHDSWETGLFPVESERCLQRGILGCTGGIDAFSDMFVLN